MKLKNIKMSKSNSEIEQHQDSYIDVVKKIGTNSKNSKLTFNFPEDKLLAGIYAVDGMAKKYLNLLCDDMTRAWIEIAEDTDGNITDYMQEINTQKVFKEAIRGSKLFGGSLIFMAINDGREPNEPVDLNSIKSIEKLKFYDRTDISIINYYKDPVKSNYGDPEFFELTTAGSIPKTVHESRCLIFKGDYFPAKHLPSNKANDDFWGASILIPVYKFFERYSIAILALYESLTKFNVDVVSIKNLMDLLKNPDGKRQLENRIEIFNISKSISNTIVLDSDEQYTTVSQQLTAVADAFSKLEQNLTAQTGIASTIFFGTSAKGLNATGDNEVRMYYDKINSMQKEELIEPLKKTIKYVMLAENFGGKKIEKPKIIFNSLWQMTDKEIVEMRNKQADTDVKYIDSGVLDPNEVRESRFNSNNYSIETAIDDSVRESSMESSSNENESPDDENNI
jgi:phage-related protein (TIGR01555 family)